MGKHNQRIYRTFEIISTHCQVSGNHACLHNKGFMVIKSAELEGATYCLFRNTSFCGILIQSVSTSHNLLNVKYKWEIKVKCEEEIIAFL